MEASVADEENLVGDRSKFHSVDTTPSFYPFCSPLSHCFLGLQKLQHHILVGEAWIFDSWNGVTLSVWTPMNLG
eukprot:scaffold1640_cov161-Amphora_coffeaeformis.AAC.41